MAAPAKAPVAQSKNAPLKKKPMFASDYDQSRFWKWQDLGDIGSSANTEIEDITEETLQNDRGEEEVKPCIWLTIKGKTKGVPLNATNRNTLRDAFGDEMSKWVGQAIVLYSTMADFRGKQVGSLRVRVPMKSKRK
jgi:hypothetical protein